MEKSEILDAFSEAEVHFGALWACFVVIPCDDEALNNEELAEAWCKDAEESAKKIKTICDSLINENVSPRAKCGKWFAGRLNRLGEDARKLYSALIGLQFPKYEVKYCLQMNIAAIVNNIRDAWRETALKVDKNEDEASTRPKAEAKKLYCLFVSGCTGKACDLADKINEAIEAYIPRKGQGYNKEIARAAAAFHDSCLGQRCLRNGFADWAPFLRAVYEAMNLKPSRYSECDVK